MEFLEVQQMSLRSQNGANEQEDLYAFENARA
jgi:hypothetical protein